MAQVTPLLPPNRIRLAGDFFVTDFDNLPGSGVIKPGYLIEEFDDSSVSKWRANSSATNMVSMSVALSAREANKGPADNYADGDTVKAGWVPIGGIFWGLIPSGQDINYAEALKTAGTGLLIADATPTADAGLALFISQEDTGGAVTVETRLRVRRIA